ATVLMMTVPGIPIILYGDEQHLESEFDYSRIPIDEVNEADGDPFSRPGMKTWDETTPAFKIIQRLAKLRKESTAIQRGRYHPIKADGDVLVYERVCEEVDRCPDAGTQNDAVLIGVNRGKETNVHLPQSPRFTATDGLLANVGAV